MLYKSERVLDLVQVDDDVAFFSCEEAIGDMIVRFDDWVDMGRPEKITVTVEPGDRLNA